MAATGTAAPGGLAVEDTPQMVLIMMDGAINQNNFPLYRRVFRNRTNPGGCRALGTFFLMHDYANYHQVTKQGCGGQKQWLLLLEENL